MKLLLTSREVCEMLGVNIKVLYRHVKEKRLGYVKLQSRGFHFTPEQVEDLIRLLTIPAKVPKGQPRPAQEEPATPPCVEKTHMDIQAKEADKASLRKEMRNWR